MSITDEMSRADAWARLRFAVIGPLLAAPPKRGQLRRELRRLARHKWTHPTSGEPTRFGVKTIERWFYTAKNAPRDPVGALRRKVRKDAGTQPSVNPRLKEVLGQQYRDHRCWSYKLHADNLAVLVERDEKLGPMPSYASVRRYMRKAGLVKRRRKSGRQTEGTERAARRLETREVRSYEAEHVHGLWHTDFHVGSLKIKLLTEQGEWVSPRLFGVLDDCSRLCCHPQWYLDETAESFVHGLSQAILKRGLPRALMSDNGSAMLAAETTEGLEALGITHETTLTESPYQNGKQESWWNQIEGRLLAMLEGEPNLTPALLNEATQAGVEPEYHRKPHDSLAPGQNPLERYLAGPDVGRPSPSAKALKSAFRLSTWRSQRQSDGTVSIEARRYEVPNRFRHVRRILVRYARWDLSQVDMVEPRSDQVLCRLYPLDKHANADGRRRRLEPLGEAVHVEPVRQPSGVAPLLEQLLEQYRASGLPPAYLPTHQGQPPSVNHEDKGQ